MSLIEVVTKDMTPYKESYWYALRVTYNREMVVKRYCDANQIISFVPMAYKISERNGIKIKELKLKFPLRYMMDHSTGKPIVVPETEMQHFMTVAGNYDQGIVYLDPGELGLKIGTRVRITGGPFEGVEGTLVRIKNNKRVVVEIKGGMIVATHYIHPSLLENMQS
jgi:hypothetical protein